MVLGDDSRSTLAVIRSLGRAGITVDLGTSDAQTLCRYSKYVRRIISLPNVFLPTREWVQALKKYLQKYRYDLIIPIPDKYILPLVRYRKEFDSIAKLAIPDDFAFHYVFNKYETVKLARRLGVPVPPEVYIDSLENLEKKVEEIVTKLNFPVVVKPVSSVIWINDRVFGRLSVRFVQNERRLRIILQDMLKITPVLVQKFVFGKSVGQEFLAFNGTVCAAFQHERVHQPLYGGGSSYRKAVALDPMLLEYSCRLLSWLKWNGVIMFEYKVDEKRGEAYLIEINGRFWGSLPLAIAAGVDFPRLLFDLLVNQRVPKIRTYNVGLYCRNLLLDVAWLIDNMKVPHSNPYLNTLPWSQVLKELYNLLSGKERFDEIVLDDPLPGVMGIFMLISKGLRTVGTKVKNMISVAFRNTTYHRRFLCKQRERILSLILQKPYILFVCKGNVCRSPVAEYYLKKLLKERNIPGFSVESAGLNKASSFSLSPPVLAIEAAKKFGIDLSHHSSKRITEEMISKSGVIFVMDKENYKYISKFAPNARNKTSLLGIFGESTSIEIPDPAGKELAQYIKSFSYIVECIDNLMIALNERLQHTITPCGSRW